MNGKVIEKSFVWCFQEYKEDLRGRLLESDEICQLEKWGKH